MFLNFTCKVLKFKFLYNKKEKYYLRIFLKIYI